MISCPRSLWKLKSFEVIRLQKMLCRVLKRKKRVHRSIYIACYNKRGSEKTSGMRMKYQILKTSLTPNSLINNTYHHYKWNRLFLEKQACYSSSLNDQTQENDTSLIEHIGPTEWDICSLQHTVDSRMLLAARKIIAKNIGK